MARKGQRKHAMDRKKRTKRLTLTHREKRNCREYNRKTLKEYKETKKKE